MKLNRPIPPIASASAFALAALFGAAQTAPGSSTLWVYSVSGLPSPITDAPTRDTLLQNAGASGVSTLYVSVYSSTADTEKRYLVDESSIAAFIAQAHAQGTQVYVAMGDSDWPAKGCGASATPYQRFADIAGYDAANPSAKFDGVMLDVEPGSNPDFPSLLSLYQCFQSNAAGDGLGLSAAINAFWNSTVTYNGVTEEAYKQIVDLKMNSLVVMGYRNTAGSLDCTTSGIACLDANIIQYANTTGQSGHILVGLDTDDPSSSGADPSETFFSLGQAAMNAAAQSVAAQLAAANLSFGGFSIHNYRQSYLSGTLTGWPATNPGLLAATRSRRPARP
jgi:hypothetical protein